MHTPHATGPAGVPTRSALLDATVALVREVARTEVMPRFLRSAASRKGDGSLLTEADVCAQQALLPRLRELADCPLVGEEMAAEEQQCAWAAGHDGLWCVDPLDGTTNFAAGLPFFSISVALLRAGRPTLGVVYDPVRDEAFHAEAGAGAWLNDSRLPESRRSVPMRHCLAAVETKRLDRALAARMASTAPFRSTRSLGSSALEWAYAAAGRFDLSRPENHDAHCSPAIEGFRRSRRAATRASGRGAPDRSRPPPNDATARPARSRRRRAPSSAHPLR